MHGGKVEMPPHPAMSPLGRGWQDRGKAEKWAVHFIFICSHGHKAAEGVEEVIQGQREQSRQEGQLWQGHRPPVPSSYSAAGDF